MFAADEAASGEPGGRPAVRPGSHDELFSTR
jgi:hypothetical protein